MASRIERRLLRVLDELADITRERALIEAELEAHRHIHDDAQRDAALGVEPLEATLTRDDVARFQRLLARLQGRAEVLEARRSWLLERLGR
ncbi:MAG TPA: hypothetical protein VLA54_08280 [Acidimicrobiia bacterium]|nr:hypothetical protein [Acidimicrobiia bacterium]